MASLFTAPQFDGGNGIQPEDGLQLFFFAEGTTAPKGTFTDEALTIPSAHPVVSDANGVFEEVWMAESSRYKVVLNDKNDVLAGFGVVEVYIAGVTTAPSIETGGLIDRLNPDTLSIWQSDSSAEAGDVVTTKERSTGNQGGAVGDVIAGTGTADGFSIVAHNTLSLSWVLRIDGDYLFAREIGVIGDGVADDTAAFVNANALSTTIRKPLWVDELMTVDVSSFVADTHINLSEVGIIGGGRITGKPLRFFAVKNLKNARFRCDDLLLDSVWSSYFEYLECDNTISLNSTISDFGVFWNTFEYTSGLMLIDVDQGQSINQNIFKQHQGGLHIFGVLTTPKAECHNNTWLSIDSTGSNITDSTTSVSGYHILNESANNQTNLILQWYAEVTGSQKIKGDFNVLGSNVDPDSGYIETGPRNNFLNARNTGRNNGDYLAYAGVNDAEGGEWDIVDNDRSRPFCLERFGSVSNGSDFGNLENIISNINAEYSSLTSSTFSGVQINFDYADEITVNLVLIYQGDDIVSIESDGNASPSFFTNFSVTNLENGWKLARAVVPRVFKKIKLYMNTSGTDFKTFSVNSLYATTCKVARLPQRPVNARRIAKDSFLTGAGNRTIDITSTEATHGDFMVSLTSDNLGGVSPLTGRISGTFAKFGASNQTAVDVNIATLVAGSPDPVTVTGNTSGINLNFPAHTDNIQMDWEFSEIYPY